LLYDRALEIAPKNIDALLNNGSALHTLKRFIEAIRCYDEVLKLDKKNTMALAYKGLSLAELGEVEEALEYFKSALELDKYYDLASISIEKAKEILKSYKKLSTQTSLD